MKKIHIIAPNIKNGGALILLEYLIEHITLHHKELYIDLHIHYNTKIITDNEKIRIISYKSNISKIFLFFKKLNNSLYFGNLPPIRRGINNLLYIHNTYLLMDKSELFSNKESKIFNLLKMLLQQMFIKLFINNVSMVACQTKIVQKKIIKKFKFENTKVLPFYKKPEIIANVKKEYDFCYISIPHPHKNHFNLFKALKILGEKGHSFSIIITIDKNKKELLKMIDEINKNSRLKIKNIGIVNIEKVYEIYNKSKCLIFPSTKESFGLPLIESTLLNLDVIASDLEYTYEVIEPSLTFIPDDYHDIANKIDFFLKNKTSKPTLKTTDKIIEIIKILKKGLK